MVDVCDLLPCDCEATSDGWIEDGEIWIGGVDRAFVVVAQAVVEVKATGDLPGILPIEIPCVDEDLALGIAEHDARRSWIQAAG